MSIQDYTLEGKATRYGEAIAAAALTQRPINYILNTTYNEKYGVLEEDHLGTSKIPVIKYVGLGVGSDYMSQVTHPLSSAVIDTPLGYIHSNEDVIPFIPFPYVMREEGSDDLTSDEREKYRMLAKLTIDGVTYNCYFLRTVDDTDEKVSTTLVTTDSAGNVTDINQVEASSAPLNPTRDKNFTGESSSTNEYIRVRAPLNLALSADDIAELINCSEILFGSSDVEITEFALVGGIERTNAFIDANNTINYNEVIGAQTSHFSPVGFRAGQRVDSGINLEFKIGQSMATA